tara:strand:- start:281 stop:550 length:270 start_codon:yes stop_codon:yes gene_type:complete
VHKSFLTLILLLSYFAAFAQINTLAKDAEISIITIGPGKQLYDSFGHNAIRVSDPSNGKDLAFNYGTLILIHQIFISSLVKESFLTHYL